MELTELIQWDEFGRIILIQRPDGFREETEYSNDGNRKIVRTHYPNGLDETERYGSIAYA